MANIFFHPSLLLLFLDKGSRMGKNQDLGSGKNIPDPQNLIFFNCNFCSIFGHQNPGSGLDPDRYSA
jgi:hypothetical protein